MKTLKLTAIKLVNIVFMTLFRNDFRFVRRKKRVERQRCVTCRFMRDLSKLKQIADYESCDPTHLDDWLKELGVEFRQYTYQMLKSGVDRRVLRFLSDEHLLRDCGIVNGVHRLRILDAGKR